MACKGLEVIKAAHLGLRLLMPCLNLLLKLKSTTQVITSEDPGWRNKRDLLKGQRRLRALGIWDCGVGGVFRFFKRKKKLFYIRSTVLTPSSSSTIKPDDTLDLLKALTAAILQFWRLITCRGPRPPWWRP